MLARTLARRVRGGSHAPALVRFMAGTPNFPPPMGKHQDPLAPDLVIEESASGLDAGLPKLYDRAIWANPDELVRRRSVHPSVSNLAHRHAPPQDVSLLRPCRGTPFALSALPLPPPTPHPTRLCAQLPERHELWWDDGTAEPEWYVDRDFPRPITPAMASAQLVGMLSFLLFGVGGVAFVLGDDLHRRAAPRAEFGWPVDREDFGRVEMGRSCMLRVPLGRCHHQLPRPPEAQGFGPELLYAL